MDALSIAHLVSVSLWAGVVLAEAVLELLAVRDEKETAFVARVHFWIDMLIELPVIAAVLVTGALLTAQIWPPPGLYILKISAALVAIGLNLYCVSQVVLRYRVTDPGIRKTYSTRVRLSGWGVPFALVAAYIGFASPR